MQYRPKPNYAGISGLGRPKSVPAAAAGKARNKRAISGRSLARGEAGVKDWSMHSDLVARCFQEMLRGESISVLGTMQVRSYAESNRTAWWDSRDEEVALRSRLLAYAEVMAIREADNAAAAERREKELREQALAEMDNESPAVNELAENDLKKATLTITHEKVARITKALPRESRQPFSAMRVPVKVTASSNMQRPSDRTGNEKLESSPGPQRSCLLEQRQRKRRCELKTDEFIKTMMTTVSEDHCKVCTRDVIHGHTSALHGHAKLLERYSASLMPASQHAAHEPKKANRTAKELNRRKPPRSFDDSFLTKYFGVLMERTTDADRDMSCDLHSLTQMSDIGIDGDVDS